MSTKRKFTTFLNEEDLQSLDERCILSSFLANQVLIERAWRSCFRGLPLPENLSDIPERRFVEHMPAIFDYDLWFNFDNVNATSSVYINPMRRVRIWVSIHGGDWQCEQTFVDGPLCTFDVDRVNE